MGAGFLLILGPAYGIFVNALIYTPLFLWLIRAPYGLAARGAASTTPAVNGFADVWSTMQVVARNRVLLSMTVLVGAASFFVGNAYQAQMPGFARDLGHGRADFAYSMLLAADAFGGLVGGLLLETRGLLQPRVRTAFFLAMIWCAALVAFARSNIYTLAVVLLFVAGFVELHSTPWRRHWCKSTRRARYAAESSACSRCPPSVCSTFSGLSVGLLGASLGIHNSLALSAAALLTLYAVLFVARYLAMEIT